MLQVAYLTTRQAVFYKLLRIYQRSVMKKILVLMSIVAGFAQSASAANFTQLGLIGQPNFRLLSEDFGSALSYKPLTPAEPLGITGFDIGLEVTSTDISKSGAALKAATGGALDVTTLIIPKLHVAKGLPLGIDVAAFLSAVPSTNIKLMGAELRYAIISGGVAMPAVAVRAAMTSMSGVDELDFNTKSLDISISKGILMFTPYAGVGQVWVNSTPKGTASALAAESFTQNKVFLGANLNLGLTNFALEGDTTGGASSYSLKFGFRW
jgi:hypothetical protein